MAPVGTHQVLLVMFSFFFLPSLPNLGSCLADRHQTLPRVLWWPGLQMHDKIWGVSEKLAAQNIKISTRFLTTSQIGRHRQCLRTERENFIKATLYLHASSALNSVSFGPQKAKIATQFRPKQKPLFWMRAL